MRSVRRPLLIAAVLCAGLRGSAAEAQTIVARHVLEGVTFEANVLGGAAVAATTDPYGNAVVAINSLDRNAELAARIYLSNCGTRAHFVLASRDAPVPAVEPGCKLGEMPGVFVVRRGTTLVIDLAETPAVVKISQGRAPMNWLVDATPDAGPMPRQAPYRLGVFAGGGLTAFRDAALDACGDAAQCEAKDGTQGATVGISYWFSPWLGAEASYAKDLKLSASGQSDDGATFSNETDPEVLMLAGKVGVTVNRVGFYARGGANFHRATTTETDVLPNITTTVAGASVVFPGGTLTSAYRTQGWGWLAGGGMDIRATDRFGIYLDARFAKLSGPALDDSPAVRNTLVTSLQIGVRFALIP